MCGWEWGSGYQRIRFCNSGKISFPPVWRRLTTATEQPGRTRGRRLRTELPIVVPQHRMQMFSSSPCCSFPKRSVAGVCTNLGRSLRTPKEHERIKFQKVQPQQTQIRKPFILHTGSLLGDKYWELSRGHRSSNPMTTISFCKFESFPILRLQHWLL